MQNSLGFCQFKLYKLLLVSLKKNRFDAKHGPELCDV